MRLDTTGGRLPHVPAVYVLTHTASGRRYVGSTTNLASRVSYHRAAARGSVTTSSTLVALMRRDGLDAFTFDVLEYVPDMACLLEREAWWGDALGVLDRRRGLNDQHPKRAPLHDPLTKTQRTVARLAYLNGRLRVADLAALYGLSTEMMSRYLRDIPKPRRARSRLAHRRPLQ
jgi:GIY-YIG catalytic domain